MATVPLIIGWAFSEHIGYLNLFPSPMHTRFAPVHDASLGVTSSKVSSEGCLIILSNDRMPEMTHQIVFVYVIVALYFLRVPRMNLPDPCLPVA